jgi:hypothetical protein
MGRAAESKPTNVAAGNVAAIGTRLAPSPQASLSTRHVATGATSIPSSVPSVASRSGWRAGSGELVYGTSL